VGNLSLQDHYQLEDHRAYPLTKRGLWVRSPGIESRARKGRNPKAPQSLGSILFGQQECSDGPVGFRNDPDFAAGGCVVAAQKPQAFL
jgi:hypothetical protein